MSRRNLVGIERYEILTEHGRGGLGRVSRARDRSLGRDVAIKELIARGDMQEVRFLREALITARLEHPSIVPIHEAGWWPDGTPFYAMKLVAGRPLRDLIAERKTVDERIGLLHHVIAVADAIAYAHGCDIIHRDLKPANVIVGDWWCDRDHKLSLLRHRDDRITSLAVAGVPGRIYAGYANGDMISLDVGSRASAILLHSDAGVQQISATRDGATVVVTTNDGGLHIGSRLATGDVTWQHFSLRAKHHALTVDGLLAVVTYDGVVWVYSLPDRAWLCIPLENKTARQIAISPDGNAGVVTHDDGRLVWLDLAQARRQLHDRSSEPRHD